MNIPVQSWQDLPVTQPIDPKTILFQAGIGVVKLVHHRLVTLLK